MHRIDTSTAQVDKFGGGKNGFTSGNPQTGELPTALDETFFDSIQEEICAIIEGAGVTLDKTKNAQALAALKLLFQPLKANLTSLAGLNGAANKFPIFTGAGSMSVADITTLALINSPTFTGTPKGPTASAGDNSKQFATTEFVAAALTALLPKRAFSTNDFIRIPDVSGGLLIQWGTGTTASTGVTCTFATPFGTPLICVTSANQTSDVNTTFQGLNTSAVFIQAYNSSGALISGTSVRYIAIGVSP